ncbi:MULTISPECIES: NAD(P)/FAD-dependent oxidoreductase [Amycolatopsis]|uniref:Pyridine nucleotide-disulfide oxidoreductase n=1 Tax=Amycolatopsis bullii TaxID=941987 RepID=A0ABQ3K1Y4_9PSEU|nr:FAD-dependent oxidoreductase [Amycolatopsis bullii]GHF93909.1 pyridine nucleotide-disulfide oxidoreductase [Amycolatopsis bullii]
MSDLPRHVVVGGASAAGLTTAENLRKRGYDGKLTLVGDEPHPPYDRPPLSKQILAGTWVPERVRLRDDDALRGLDATLLLGHRATGLDPATRRVSLDDGATLEYDALVIATGVTPRELPGTNLDGVHRLRTLDDALALRTGLLAGPKVVVVGAGFLGAEVAAVARRMDLEVTLVDPLSVPMRRQFGDRVGDLVGRLHRDHGTTLRCGVGVARFLGSGGRVIGVELADESVLDADLVLVAVGSTPATTWLVESGLPLGNGVECDEFCRAAPGVYAAGDVASWPNTHFGLRMRLEHRMNATEQGMAVAAAIMGEAKPFAPVPYFWTDQYDTKIQAYGIFPEDARVQLLDGGFDERKFIAAYVRDDTVVGVLGWDEPRRVREARRLVVEQAPLVSAAGSRAAMPQSPQVNATKQIIDEVVQ